MAAKGKSEMHARHHAEKRALHTKHEAEMKAMQERHDQEMGAEAQGEGGMAEAPMAGG